MSNVKLPPPSDEAVSSEEVKKEVRLIDDLGIQANIPTDVLQTRSLFVATPMYSGMCTGLYTRSLMHLVELCKELGVVLYLHFLSNESLIQRARNYCCDEFLRARHGPMPAEGEEDTRQYFTHMMFIDADIGFDARDIILMLAMSDPGNDKDVICGPYPKKSVPYDTLVTTEDGLKKIGWIVNNKYDGKVLTINESTGKSEWNKIVEYHHNPNNNKWIKLELSNNIKRGPKVITTNDHEMSVVYDPLAPMVNFLRADEMVGHYTMTHGKSGKLFNSECVSALIGTLLGDSCISKKANRLSCGHGEKQKDYIDMKRQLFGGAIKKYKNNGYGKNNESSVYLLTSAVNGQTKYLREIMYIENKKTVKNVLRYMNEISMAFWYMDDGCLKKSGNTSHYCEFNTQGFEDDDQYLLQQFLNDKYGFDVQIDEMRAAAKSRTDVIFKRLRLKNEDSAKFFEMIAKYIPPHMEYKLPAKYQGGVKHVYDSTPLEYKLHKVSSFETIKLDSDQYDIGIENNHNFMIGSMMNCVRNCISWEKIKMGVDKGYADKDPNVLERFVGDYVFNPKQAGPMSFVQPVEILEGGTGFMLIQRQAFDKFRAMFPAQAYKPDHVRTKNFDGTREIFAYFDCIIDRGYTANQVDEIISKLANDESTPELVAKAKEFLEIGKTASKRYLSEDYMFCQFMQKAGGKIWLLPWVKLQHAGSYIFGGSLPDLAQLGVSATADPTQLGGKK